MKTKIWLAILCCVVVRIKAQVLFTLSSAPSVGSGPQFVVAADVNADGRIDLMTADANNTVAIFTNNGLGGFVFSSSPNTGQDPVSITAADVNEDGNIDIISGNYIDNNLTVLTNNGYGGFMLSSSPSVGSEPLSVTAADVNGDGKVDLIGADSANSANAITVLTNNGNGGFTSSGTYAVGFNPWSVITADVNGDSNLDLIAANYGDGTLTVLLNNGSGGFSGAAITLPVGNNPRSVTAADLNGDGHADLICANKGDNTISVLINDGNGGYNSTTYGVGSDPVFVGLADVNGDGATDLISANNGDATITVLTNDGSGGFSVAGTFPVGNGPRAVAAADVDGDGRVDLLVVNENDGTVSVLTNGTPFPPPTAPVIINQPMSQTNIVGSFVHFTVGVEALIGLQQFGYQWRFNGTNLPTGTNNVLSLTNLLLSQAGSYDVVVTNVTGSVTSSPAILGVVVNNQMVGRLAFGLSSSPSVGAGPQFVSAADINADGKVDLIATSTANSLSVLTNNGAGGFLLSSSPGTGNNPISIVQADVNGDGAVDLISANYSSSTLTVLTNDGSGKFTAASSPNVGSLPLSVAVADVNGDGNEDLISADSASQANSVTVLTNNGSGRFFSSGSYPVGSNPWSVISADINGDQKMDLVTANYASGTLTVLTNDGGGRFATSAVYSVGHNPRAVAAADVNGDGAIDLISANMSDNTLSVLTNDGIGHFVVSGVYSVGSSPVFTAAADINGDGLVDLISANYNGNTLTALTNDGTGHFGLADTFLVGSGPRAVVATDINGDGRPDIVAVNQNSGTLSVLTNATLFPPPSEPVIVSQPLSQTDLVGAKAQFAVGAKTLHGVQLFGYQWQFNGTNILSATNSFLLLTNLTLSQAGTYDVVVTNIAGSVTSSPAFLDVASVLVKVNGQQAFGSVSALSSAVLTVTGFPAGFIFYTLDGTVPTLNSAFYTGPITLSNSAVVQAMSLSSDFSQTAYSTPVTVQILAPLNAGTPGGGTLTVNGQPASSASYYLTGSTLTLTANASDGWSFLGWQGSVGTADNPLSLTMSETDNVRAVFGTVVTTNALGGGAIVLSKPNPLPYGTSLTASVLANPGNYFLSWGGSVSGTNAPVTVMVTNSNLAISALFAPLPAQEYSLSVVVIGDGSVSNLYPRSYYNPGDAVTLKAITNSGAYFLGWNQDASGTNNLLTLVMNTNKIVKAIFGVAPIVSVIPTNTTIPAGSNLVLTATASGSPLLSYQWWDSAGIIPGATNSALAITIAQPTNAGSYYVIVTNSFGSATSAVAVVNVTGFPVITNQPASLTVTIGHAATFVVGAVGWPALTYQWQFDEENIPGATNISLTVSHAFMTNDGNYAVVITNVYGSVTSNPVKLAVEPLEITGADTSAGGHFGFTFDTAVGVQYQVEYSTNLVDWHPWLSVDGLGLPLTMGDDSVAGAPQRFYRVVVVP